MKLVAATVVDLMNIIPSGDMLPHEETAEILTRSIAFTVKDERDRIVIMFGALPLWKGVVEVWMIPTELFLKRYKFGYKMVKTTLDQAIRYMKPHRVQTAVRDDLPRNIAFIKRLGFSYEGPLVKYGPNGENFMRFVRLP